jgi:PAS domain S-box-containing protein
MQVAASEADQWNSLLSGESDAQLLRQLEQRLADGSSCDSGSQWRAIVESISDGICASDAEGRIVQANPAFAALVGAASPDILTGRSACDSIVAAAPGDSEQLVDRVTRGMNAFVCELRRGAEPADGVLRVACVPLQGAADFDGNSVWQIRDVTHQKLAEEARNQFVFTATHELRTPLCNLKAYAETLALQDGIDIDRQKEFCNVINSEATRLARFVDELLNISQMEGGGLSVAKHQTDVERMLKEVLDHVRAQFDKKSQTLETSLPAKLPKLSVDKDKIAGALINLLGNACKYTPDNGMIRFTVEVEPGSLAIHVEDSGYGISSEELPHIFDKFFRSSDEQVRNIEGTGLGLAFAKEVVRLHGGGLTAQSKIGRGSRFTLTLPMDSQNDQA